MPELLHPAAPVVPAAPALPVALPAAPALPIDVAVPDEPAPVGDRWPCHLFWAPPAEPLPPVLRPDHQYDPTAHAVQLGLLPPGCLPPAPVELPRASLAFVAGSVLLWGASAGLTAFLLYFLLTFFRP